MKKSIIILLVLTMMLSVVACGNSTTTPETKPAESNTPATGDAPNDEKTVTLKFGMISAETHSSYVATEKFKEYVEKESGGSIKVELYPNGLLGSDVQLSEAVALGTVEMALPATSVFTMYDMKFGILDLPYLFKDVNKAFDALDGEVGDELDKILEDRGIVNLGYGFNGVRNMTNNIRPIKSPADLAGLKMRCMENPVFIDMFTYLGANATPMSFGELFTGLQQKTVDGQENPASLIYESRFQEVQKYFSDTRHVNNFLAYIINKDLYESLSENQRKVLDDGAKEFLVDWQRKTEIDENEMYIEKLAADGMK